MVSGPTGAHGAADAPRGPVGRFMFWYAGVCYDRPWRVLLGAFSVLSLVSLLGLSSGIASMTGGIDPDAWRFAIFGRDEMLLDYRAMKDAEALWMQRTTGDQGGATVDDVPERSLPRDDRFFLAYRSESGDMIQWDQMRGVRRVEEPALMLESWDKYCLRKYDRWGRDEGCRRPKSLANFVFPRSVEQVRALHNGYGVYEKDPAQAAGDLAWDMLANRIGLTDDLYFEDGFYWYFQRGFGTYNIHSQHLLSQLSFGQPLPGFKPGESLSRQNALTWRHAERDVDAVLRNVTGIEAQARWPRSPYLYRAYAPGTADEKEVEVLWFSVNLFFHELERSALEDVRMSGIAMACIATWVLFHTRSLLVTLAGTCASVLAFPLTYIVFRYVAQITYFEVTHLVAVFLFLGVGADDVFVFFDFLAQALAAERPGAQRKATVQHAAAAAGRSVFATSLSTSVAFAVAAVTKRVAVASFCAFCSIGFGMLWACTVALLTPACAIWAARRPAPLASTYIVEMAQFGLDKPAAGAGAGAGDEGGDHAEDTPLVGDGAPRAAQARAPHGGSRCGCVGQCLHATSRAADAARAGIGLFLGGPWATFVRVLRFPIVLGFGVLLWHGATHVLQIEGDNRLEESFFDDSHMFNRFLALLGRGGPYEKPADTTVRFVWGVKGMDRTGKSFWDTDDPGTVMLDEDLDFSSPSVQGFMLYACGAMVDPAFGPCTSGLCDGVNLVRPRTNIIAVEEKEVPIPCFFRALEDHLQDKYHKGEKDAGQLLGRLSPEDFAAEVKLFWRSHNLADEIRTGVVVDMNATEPAKVLPFFVNKLVLGADAKTSAETQAVYRDLEHVRDRLRAQAPVGAKGVKVLIGHKFAVMRTQDALVRFAQLNMLLVLVFAWIVLLFLTRSLVLATCVAVMVAGIVCTVVGSLAVAWRGYKLGLAEVVSVALVIGFSVDYGTHIVMGYIDSPAPTREARTRDALRCLGMAVVSACTTTAGSAAVLVATRLLFFQRMAFFVVGTLASSLVWSLTFLTALLMIVGPQPRARTEGGRAGVTKPVATEAHA
ncbi:unnamed protein product [Pedinophyceae sp. YPF-701]|nr:unnamed protein product [Pedinophyceae sp. YPF-701]